LTGLRARGAKRKKGRLQRPFFGRRGKESRFGGRRPERGLGMGWVGLVFVSRTRVAQSMPV